MGDGYGFGYMGVQMWLCIGGWDIGMYVFVCIGVDGRIIAIQDPGPEHMRACVMQCISWRSGPSAHFAPLDVPEPPFTIATDIQTIYTTG